MMQQAPTQPAVQYVPCFTSVIQNILWKSKASPASPGSWQEYAESGEIPRKAARVDCTRRMHPLFVSLGMRERAGHSTAEHAYLLKILRCCNMSQKVEKFSILQVNLILVDGTVTGYCMGG